MKPKTFLLGIACILATALASHATIVLSFDDSGAGGGTATSGTYSSNDRFTLTLNLSYTDFSAFGLTYYLEASSALAPALTITGINYSTFTDPNSTITTETFAAVSGSDSGFLSNAHDLGATTDAAAIAAGSYMIAQITFALTGAADGTYTLQSTTVLPKNSIVTDSSFGDNTIPAASYTITVVPEPSSAMLLGVALVFILRLRRRQA